MGPRAGLSTVLIVGGITLLIAIAIGNSMGNRVLGQVAGRIPAVQDTPFAVPSSTPGGPANVMTWKRVQVMSVATDPGFPDPRVTPAPEETPTPKPRPKPRPSPSPKPSPSPAYTSPPLPIPLSSEPVDQYMPSPDSTGPYP